MSYQMQVYEIKKNEDEYWSKASGIIFLGIASAYDTKSIVMLDIHPESENQFFRMLMDDEKECNVLGISSVEQFKECWNKGEIAAAPYVPIEYIKKSAFSNEGYFLAKLLTGDSNNKMEGIATVFNKKMLEPFTIVNLETDKEIPGNPYKFRHAGLVNCHDQIVSDDTLRLLATGHYYMK